MTFSDLKNIKDNNIIDFNNKNDFKLDKFDNNASYNKDYNIDSTYKKDDNILFLFYLLILSKIRLAYQH